MPGALPRRGGKRHRPSPARRPSPSPRSRTHQHVGRLDVLVQERRGKPPSSPHDQRHRRRDAQRRVTTRSIKRGWWPSAACPSVEWSIITPFKNVLPLMVIAPIMAASAISSPVAPCSRSDSMWHLLHLVRHPPEHILHLVMNLLHTRRHLRLPSSARHLAGPTHTRA
jgi:hypothetical protein